MAQTWRSFKRLEEEESLLVSSHAIEKIRLDTKAISSSSSAPVTPLSFFKRRALMGLRINYRKEYGQPHQATPLKNRKGVRGLIGR